MDFEFYFDNILNFYNVSSIKELAIKIETGPSTISNWKQRRSITALKKKCRELGIYNEIFGETTFSQTGANSQQIQNQNNAGSGMINQQNDKSNPTQLNTNLDIEIINLIEGASTVANSLGKKEKFKEELTRYITTELIPKISTM